MFSNDPSQICKRRLGYSNAVDSAYTVRCVQNTVLYFPKIVEDVKGGKQQAIGRLIGEAKKQNPNINPGQFRQVCLEMIDEM